MAQNKNNYLKYDNALKQEQLFNEIVLYIILFNNLIIK